MIAVALALLAAAGPAKDAPRPAPARAEVPLPPPPAGTLLQPSPPQLQVPPPQRLPAGASATPGRGVLRIAVLDPVASPEVPARPLAAFSQALVPELRKLEGVSAIGMAEVRDMLGFEYQRQMLGCEADDKCLAEIAGALGVDELVTTSLVLVRSSYAVTLKRLDLTKARVLQSESRTLERRDGEELLGFVGPAIAALFPDRGLRPGKTRGVEAAAIRRLNPPPLPAWIFYGTSGAAAVALGGGVVSHLLVSGAKDDFSRLAERSRTTPVPASDLTEAQNRVRSLERRRNAFLFTGAALAVAAGIEAFFTDWRNDRAALAAPIALEGGAGVMVAGRF